METSFSAEFIGTMVLVLLGDGAVANVLLKNSKGENSGWIVITTGWGLAVAMGVYITGWVSGAHINPAVTIAMVAIGDLSIISAVPYIFGQCFGAAVGAYLVYLTYKAHWKGTEDPDLKLSVFCTMPAIRKFKYNFLTEIIGTAVLLFGILGISNQNNGLSGGVGPIAIGLLIFAIGLSLGGPTGYAINPARDLIPRMMHTILPIPGKRGSDWQYAWVPVIGPIIGGVLGAVLYKVISCNWHHL
ncbi:MAG: aquaporin family protein [Victivallales bacterium]|nr:aquaporin family protein [Victivallales bacterium]MCF7889111.1 aquaporin family protein [Victivallales bacterium]